MIGPGCVPRPGRVRIRTLSYVRVRRRGRTRRRAPGSPVRQAAIVAFDHGPSEFPIATLRPREPRGQALAALGAAQRWLVARWTWLKPRAVPVVVAALGMIFMIESASYLSHVHEPAPAPAPTHVVIQVR